MPLFWTGKMFLELIVSKKNAELWRKYLPAMGRIWILDGLVPASLLHYTLLLLTVYLDQTILLNPIDYEQLI